MYLLLMLRRSCNRAEHVLQNGGMGVAVGRCSTKVKHLVVEVVYEYHIVKVFSNRLRHICGWTRWANFWK